MWGFRDRLRAEIAIATPRTALAQALWRAGCPASQANGTANDLFHYMCKRGRAGVRAVINTHYLAPPELRSAILAEMFARQVNPSGFGAALACDWTDRSSLTVAAAGTRERLVEWFRYANFGLPFVRRFCDVEALPAAATVWRGVRGEAAAGAAGMSWTPSRILAADYAYRTWLEWQQPGESVLLRREVTRDQVLAYFVRYYSGEAVLGDTGPYEIDTTDAGEIAALAAAAELIAAAGKEQSERIKAEFMAMTEDEIFGEWRE